MAVCAAHHWCETLGTGSNNVRCLAGCCDVVACDHTHDTSHHTHHSTYISHTHITQHNRCLLTSSRPSCQLEPQQQQQGSRLRAKRDSRGAAVDRLVGCWWREAGIVVVGWPASRFTGGWVDGWLVGSRCVLQCSHTCVFSWCRCICTQCVSGTVAMCDSAPHSQTANRCSACGATAVGSGRMCCLQSVCCNACCTWLSWMALCDVDTSVCVSLECMRADACEE